MNDTITITNGGTMDDYGVITSTGISPITTGAAGTYTISSGGAGSTITLGVDPQDVLDTWEMNRVTVDHKVQEHELLKLKETVPTYADEIKENLTKTVARDIMKKITFTKKHDKDADVHHFIGRVWVFTEDELKSFIKDVKGL
jgi:hypothetical protein